MILSEELSKLVTLDRYELSNIFSDSGYSGISFESVKFLGISESNTFCYRVKYFDESGTGEQTTKVYINKNASGKLVADF